MSEFLAEAQVVVLPNTSGFRTQLVKELEAATKKPVPVTITPDMKGFQKSLREGVLASSKNVVARIRVTPDFKGFRAALQEGVARSTQGITARIGVAPGQVRAGSAAAGTGAAGTAQATAAESKAVRELAAAREAESFARKKIIGDLTVEEKRVERLARLELALATASRASATALKEQNVEVRASARALEDRTRAEIAAIEATTARAAAPRERAAAREQARAATRAAAAKATRDLANAEAFVAQSTNAVTAARERLGVASTAVASAQKAFNTSLLTSNRAMQTQAALALVDARSLEVLRADALSAAQAEAALAEAQAKTAATAASRRGFGLRGFGAQLATFAGLRGAVLSANAAFIGGTVAAIAFGKAVQSAASFESELNVFRVTSAATADQMERVRAAAQALGRDITLPGVGAGDAAQAMTELGKAGLSVEDSLSGARGVLQLATAAAISNAEATELAASALNAFGLSGDQAVRVADVLTNAANAAQGSITDMGIALQQSSAVARQVGVSLEDTVALLTLLARNGIRGSDAGTALRVAFTRLIAPTAQAAAVLDQLNVRVRDAQGNLRPGIFSDIADAQRDLTRAQQDANAKIIFGVDALRAYSIVAREGEQSLNNTRAGLERQGAASELANARMAGLTGSAENVKNQFESLGLTLGQIASGPIKGIADTTAAIVSSLNSLAQSAAAAIKPLFDLKNRLTDLTTVNIAGLDIGPLQSIPSLVRGSFGVAADVLNSSKGDILEARGEIAGLFQDLNKVGGNTPVTLNKTVLRLQEIREKLQGGGKDSQAFAKDVDVLIKRLQEASATPVEMNFILPPEVLAGEPGRLAGRASKEAFEREFKFGLGEDFGFGAFFSSVKAQSQQTADEMFAAFAAGARRFIAETKAALRGFQSDINVLEGQALDIQIAGGPQEQQKLLAKLREREAVLREAVETQRDLLKPNQQSSPGLREAQAALIENRDQQQAILDQQAAEEERAKTEAERRAGEIQQARDDADKAVLKAFQRREATFDARAFQADQDKTLKNDLAVEKARKKFLFSRIAIFRRLIKDPETLRDALADVREKLRAVDAEIAGIQQDIIDNARDSRDAVRDTLAKRIRLAELRVGPEGQGRDALLGVINKAIANARLRIKNWKKWGLTLLDEKIALEELIDQRDEVLKAAKGGTENQGTTAFELLRQAAETFTSNAGTLVGGNQPFTGPTGFTADLAQFLRRNSSSSTGRTSLSPATPGKSKFEINDDRLVRSLDRLANVIEGTSGGRNRSTATKQVSVGDIALNDKRWRESRNTRKDVEANSES